MGGWNFDETHLKKALQAQACSYNPPNNLKQQIDERLAWKKEEKMKKFSAKKAVAAAAVACLLTGTVCAAAEKINILYVASSSALTETQDFQDIAKLEKKAGVKTGAVKSFQNGFVFKNANIMDVGTTDGSGNVKDGFNEVYISYGKGGKDISYTVREGTEKYSEEELARLQAVESNGITYLYSQSDYLFVPQGYEPTEEEQEAAAAGKLFISEGSAQREAKACESLSWEEDGQSYSLLGMDLDMGADGLIAMAQQLK